MDVRYAIETIKRVRHTSVIMGLSSWASRIAPLGDYVMCMASHISSGARLKSRGNRWALVRLVTRQISVPLGWLGNAAPIALLGLLFMLAMAHLAIAADVSAPPL